jgi:hypothetical protein
MLKAGNHRAFGKWTLLLGKKTKQKTNKQTNNKPTDMKKRSRKDHKAMLSITNYIDKSQQS